MHEALGERAEAARRHALRDPRLTGGSGTMVLNGAYLVATGDQAGFVELVRTLVDRHPEVRLELTGPWPPYSFAVLDDAEARP